MPGPVPPPAPLPPDVTDFIPKVRQIANITNANPAVVTTLVNHGYQAGLYVRIVIPYPGSMEQIKNLIFPITILSANQFSVPINSTNFFPFTLSSTQYSQSVPVSEYTGTLVNAVDNIAPA